MASELLKVDVIKKFGENPNLTLSLPYIWGEIAVRFANMYTHRQKVDLCGEILILLSRDKLATQIFVATKLEKVIVGLIDMHRKLDRSAKPIFTFF
tara:strand:- start:791 stop:1078 length:288 start_codon:yes stop_codon:yes gene_type:complete